MIRPVELPIEIVLISAPRHAGHQIDDVPVIAPGADQPRKLGADTISHRHIGVEVDARCPRISALKVEPLLDAALCEFAISWRLRDAKRGGKKKAINWHNRFHDAFLRGRRDTPVYRYRSPAVLSNCYFGARMIPSPISRKGAIIASVAAVSVTIVCRLRA